jgi:membrane protein
MSTPSGNWLQQLRQEALAILEGRALDTPDDAQLSRLRKLFHVCVLVGESFVRNRCPARASALAYTTLLALIPLFAVVLSVTTSLLKKEGEKPVEQLIDQVVGNLAPQLNLEVKSTDSEGAARRQEVVKSITTFIANIQTGTLGATGMIGLVFVAIMLLSNIEATFNDIWGVEKGRSWLARVVQYWAAITLGPVVLIVVVGLTTGPHLMTTKEIISEMPMAVKFLFDIALALLPFGILILAFTLLYQLMPNTQVNFRAALVGGFVGGTLWQLNNLFNVIYVSKVVTYSKIYGSFGVVPIFLIGLYFSWLIMLFGAQVAYAFQNRSAYMQAKQAEHVHQQGREFVALRVMTLIAARFASGTPPLSVTQLAHNLAVSARLVQQVTRTMLGAGLLLEVNQGAAAFTPAKPLAQITCHDILQAMRSSQGQEPPTRIDEQLDRVRGELAHIQDAEREAASRVTLLELVEPRQG